MLRGSIVQELEHTRSRLAERIFISVRASPVIHAHHSLTAQYPLLAVGGRCRCDNFPFFILAPEQANLEKQLWEARAITEDPDFGGKEFLISSSKSGYEKVAIVYTSMHAATNLAHASLLLAVEHRDADRILGLVTNVCEHASQILNVRGARANITIVKCDL